MLEIKALCWEGPCNQASVLPSSSLFLLLKNLESVLHYSCCRGITFDYEGKKLVRCHNVNIHALLLGANIN